MPQVIARIVEKAEPQFGKKRGRIKDASGLIYQISPALAQMVQVGGTYDLIYKDDEFKGNKFRVVESLTTSGMTPIGPPPRPQTQAPAYNPQQVQPAYPDEKGNDIATLAIAKVWLEKVPVGDEVGALHALRAARRAWLQFKANPNNVETGSQGYDDTADFR